MVVKTIFDWKNYELDFALSLIQSTEKNQFIKIH